MRYKALKTSLFKENVGQISDDIAKMQQFSLGGKK